MENTEEKEQSSAIEAINLRYAYDGTGRKKQALRGVDLTVGKGEFLAVLGCNGCGKSTLVKHFNALLRVQKGSLFVSGRNVAESGELRNIRRACGMVFQNPDNQFVSSLVGEDVAFGLENYEVPETEIPARVAASLAEVGLPGFEERATNLLSGGQKQRAAIAGVIAVSPEIIVFDEATAMLDPEGRAELLSVMRRLHEKGRTVVMISHYVEEAVSADRVVLMHDGKIAADGAPREILTNPALLREAGLLPPFPVRVFWDLKKRGVALARCPLRLTELSEELCRLI